MRRSGKALVFGDDTRSFLAVVRSLGRAGIDVHAAPLDARSASLRSKFITAAHRVPLYVADGADWCAYLERLIRREAYNLVIPCDERTLLPLDRHRATFDHLCRLAIPDHDVLTVLFDKHRTRELAISLGIPVAPGRVVRSSDSARAIATEFGLPVVIKPNSSYTLETLYERGRAQICSQEGDLARALRMARHRDTIVEGYRPGRGIGLSILASSGRVLQAFQHARARERGGASFYRMSTSISPELAISVESMVAALRFTGIAMFEFKLDNGTGSWVLLEVNARPWGSLPLPLALGIDFPLRWYRLLVEGEETPERPYRVGVYQRNLLPDMRQVFVSARDEGTTRWAKLTYFLRVAAEFRRVLTGREHLDTVVLDDPVPGLYEVYRATMDSFARLVRGPLLSRVAGRARDKSIVRRVMRRSRGEPVVIVVLCSGNICRSPFATELLRRALFSRSARVEVLSAGLLPRSGNCSPRVAIEVARDHGVDLSTHRSAYLSEADAQRAAVAVIFDRENREQLKARYPELLERAVLLGSFFDGEGGGRDITDPDGGDRATLVHTYGSIAMAVAGLAAAIESEPRG